MLNESKETKKKSFTIIMVDHHPAPLWGRKRGIVAIFEKKENAEAFMEMFPCKEYELHSGNFKDDEFEEMKKVSRKTLDEMSNHDAIANEINYHYDDTCYNKDSK